MVDGSVVMMENIFSHLTRPDPVHADENPIDGSNIAESPSQRTLGIRLRIQEAAKEIASPVFFAVMIIVVVFAPLFALEGVEGKLFQPMAISIVLAMLASLLVALIVIPALASFLFKREPVYKESPVLRPIAELYQSLLSKAMAQRARVVGLAAGLFALSLLVLTQLGTEFVPELEEGTLNIRTTLAPSSSLETSVTLAPKLEAAEVGGDPEPVSNIETYVGLKPVSEWTSAGNRYELQKLMEEKLSVHPGLLFSFSQPIATRVDELLSGVKAQLAIKLFGSDLDVLAKKGQELEALAKQVEGTIGVSMEQIAGEAQLVVRPEAQLVVRPDREALARYGMAVEEIMSIISDGVGGESAGQVINGNERYNIYVRLEKAARANADTISNLLLESPNGACLQTALGFDWVKWRQLK